MRQSYTTAAAAAAAAAAVGNMRNAPRGCDDFRRLETGSLMTTPPWNSERKRQNELRYKAAFNPP